MSQSTECREHLGEYLSALERAAAGIAAAKMDRAERGVASVQVNQAALIAIEDSEKARIKMLSCAVCHDLYKTLLEQRARNTL